MFFKRFLALVFLYVPFFFAVQPAKATNPSLASRLLCKSVFAESQDGTGSRPFEAIFARVPFATLPPQLKLRNEMAEVAAALRSEGDNPTQFLLLTQAEFTRAINGYRTGGLARLELPTVETSQEGQLRKVPALAFLSILSATKNRKMDIRQTLSDFKIGLEKLKALGLVFDTPIGAADFAARTPISHKTKSLLAKLDQLGIAIELKTNPFEESRPQYLGQISKDILSSDVGLLGKYSIYEKTISIHLFHRGFLEGLVVDPNHLWKQIDGIISHEGFHGLSANAGFEIIKFGEVFVHPYAGGSSKNFSIAEVNELFIRAIAFSLENAMDLSAPQRFSYVAKVMDMFSGGFLTAAKYELLKQLVVEMDSKIDWTASEAEVIATYKNQVQNILTDLTKDQLAHLSFSIQLYSTLRTSFEELIAHEKGGQSIEIESYNIHGPFIDYIKQEALPRWKSFYRKPELFD